MSDIVNSTGTNVGPVWKGRTLEQAFVSRDDNLVAVSVLVATYRVQIHSTAVLTLLASDRATTLRRAELATMGFDDNSWQRFAFEPIAGSRGKTFVFRFETNSEAQAVTLWTNNLVADGCLENGQPTNFGAICFKTHYVHSTHALLDPLLDNYAADGTELSIATATRLHEIIRRCVCEKEYYFLRLVHMLDAFNRTDGVERVLSIGCGQSLHEAYLATRFPHIDVHATDAELQKYDFDLPNLRFSEIDILDLAEPGQYDFVFSIECLEHIAEYAAAFRNMAAQVRPGGWLYLSVPFATQAEQADSALKALAAEVYGHVVAGFDFQTLDDYFAAARFDVLLSSNMFRRPLAGPLNGILDGLDTVRIESILEDVVRLFLLDLAPLRAESMRNAEGIKYLGRRRVTPA